MRIHFVCKPWELGCGTSSVQRFFDIFKFQDKSVTLSLSKIKRTAFAFRIVPTQYPEILREIKAINPDWVVIAGRANYDLVSFLHKWGCDNIVIHDQDELICDGHYRQYEKIKGHAAIIIQEHKQIVQLFSDYARLGVFWLPPHFSRYMEPTNTQKMHDIGFLGYVNEYRDQFIDRVFKNMPPTIDTCCINSSDGLLFGEDVGNFYASCKIVIGLPRMEGWEIDSAATSSRVFQVLGAGSFYLMHQVVPANNIPFKSGEHLITFKDEQELINLASYYLENGNERERIAQAGRIAVYKQHLDVHRADEFWQLLEQFTKKEESANISHFVG
jgi:hypothetical protein